MSKVFVSIIFLLNFNLYSQDIDLFIKQIQNASAQDRVKLMNSFKERLRAMNSENRMKAIIFLQKKQHINKKITSEKSIIQKNIFNNNAKNILQQTSGRF